MATEVVIPKLGMTMKEGKIVEWVAADGAAIEPEQVLYVLATDKLDTDVWAETAGTLRQAVPAGTVHPVGTVVGWVLEAGEAPPPGASPLVVTTNEKAERAMTNGTKPAATTPAANDAGSEPRRLVASPYARRLAGERGVSLAMVIGSGPRGRVIGADVPAASARVRATPVARALADKAGIDLRTLTGTGPGGRITKEDVAGADRPGVQIDVARVDLRTTSDHVASVPFQGMRKVIAERMHASLQDMAQLTLGMEVDATDAATLRHQLIAEWESDAVGVSYTDLVARAAVKALAIHPALNASLESDVIRLHRSVHLGVAVAVDDGLLVPVIRDADKRDLRSQSAESARLARACRGRTVRVDELTGSTFTVTALGANGIDFFTPVINPPNVAILGVGRVHDGVGWEGDRPVKRQLMTLSLTIDHRAVDGAPGAAFLATVRDLLQAPYRLLV